MTHDIIIGVVGFFIGGAVTAASTKLFGWFSKQEASVAKKIP